MRWLMRIGLALGLLAFLSAPALACGPETRIDLVQTDGRYVTWVHFQNNTQTLLAGTIGAHNTITNVQEITTKIEHLYSRSPTTITDRMGGGIVAWHEYGPDKTTRLMLRDLTDPTSVNTLIKVFDAADARSISTPAVAVRNLVWVEGQSIVKYNPDTDTFTTIKTYARSLNVTAPQISSTWIVWKLIRPNNQETLVLSDIDGKTIKNLVTFTCMYEYGCDYALSGDRLLYKSSEADGLTTKVRNLSTGKTITVPEDPDLGPASWTLADGDFVYNTIYPRFQNLQTGEVDWASFGITDVRDGWVVGYNGEQVYVMRSSDL